MSTFQDNSQELQNPLFLPEFQKQETIWNDGYAKTTDMLLVTPQRLLFCNNYRRSVLLVDSKQGEIRSDVQVPGRPFSICLVKSGRAAVALSDAKTVQYITIKDDTLALHKTMSVNGEIMGICAIKDTLAVSYATPAAVEVINKKGKVIKRIDNYMYSTGEKIFQEPHYITVSPDQSKIFVSDFGTDTVFMLNTDLQLLKTFYDPNLMGAPCGIIMFNDKLLICSLQSKTIVLLEPSSGKMSPILKEGVGPQALAFSSDTRTLYMVDLDAKIHKYRLK